MSWDIALVDDRGHTEGVWGYTHNCNGMIEDALGGAVEGTAKPFWAGWNYMGSRSWWELLDDKTGPEGRDLLDAILGRLRGDPEKYRAMNPPNGWGDYDSLIGVLTEMRDRVPEWPTLWRASG